MKKFLFTLVAFFLFPALSFAAAAVTLTINAQYPDEGIVELKYACTTHTDGAVANTTAITGSTVATNLWSENGKSHIWEIVQVTIDPTSTHDAAWDLELQDSSDSTIDYLGGLGDNLGATATRIGQPVDEINGGPMYLTALPVISSANSGSDADTFNVYVKLKRAK